MSLWHCRLFDGWCLTGSDCPDLASKSTALSLDIDGVQVHLGGTCKGSGMIHPNMATMLGVITCDAPVDAGVWQSMLVNATRKSFNMVCLPHLDMVVYYISL